MKAAEGSLDAPEDTKADASRKLFSWKIPEDARAGGNRILIDGSVGDARFGGNKECIGGSTGEGIAQRKLNGSQPVKPEGETADANRRRSQSGGRSNNRRKPGVEPAEPMEQRRCESEVDRRPCRRRIVSAQVERDRHRSVGRAEQPAQAGCAQPVEPIDTTPIRAAELTAGRAGVENSRRKSRVLKPAPPRGRDQPANTGGSAAGGAGGCNAACTASSSRLKRQRLRSLAFSI